MGAGLGMNRTVVGTGIEVDGRETDWAASLGFAAETLRV